MIELRDVTIRAGSFELSNLQMTVPSGSYAALMGRTGKGKTTILEAICGLRPIVSGGLWIDGVDVTDWAPGDRRIGYVPQDLALFPTFTVQEHLEFALVLRKDKRSDANRRAKELAEALGITELMPRKIQGLSGGERQRVALGRALSFQPSVMLLDEPLSALDESTVEEIQTLLADLKDRYHATTIHVTHRPQEAAKLADQIHVLEDGVLRVIS